MQPVICLKDFIEEMDCVSEEIRVFLNIQTGKFVLLTREILDAMEAAEADESSEGIDENDSVPEWQTEMMQEADEVLSNADYRELPDQFDIDEYSIMERFCFSMEDEMLSSRLLKSIQGKGAFRRFKDTVHECGIAEDWYAWREDAFKEVARDWLENNGVAFRDEQ
ncbi:MAG: hypothetical protein HGA97_08255 [Chlorobiaceae bacterium]|nr:hypothetical protein [Chlorobiaceae bacterium]